jgi:hypothetical protein
MGTDVRDAGPVQTGLPRLLTNFSGIVLLAGLLAMVAVVAVYVYHLASNIRSDTTAVTNGAFIITGTLSALCFSWAQSLLPEDKDRNRVLRAGERLLHSSLFLIIASVLKYAALTLMTYQTAEIPRPTLRLVGDGFGLLAAPLFLFAIGDAFAGTFVMFRTLWPRTRYFGPAPPP